MRTSLHRPEERSSASGTLAAPADSTHRLRLLHYPHPLLRQVCHPVEVFDKALRDLRDEMFALMRRHRGMCLTAPQVGVKERILICEFADDSLCLVNPSLRHTSSPTHLLESCLSLPGIRVNVRRWERITVVADDVNGRSVTYTMAGLYARLVQHAICHLNGAMIHDRSRPVTNTRSPANRLRSRREYLCHSQ